MPYCPECSVWYPYVGDGDDRDFLLVAYHKKWCSARDQDWEGDMDAFIFEGDIMYEVQPDGSKVAVSTFSEFPKPYDEVWAAKEKPEVRPRHAYNWDEWKKKHGGYADAAERAIAKAEAHRNNWNGYPGAHTYNGNQQGTGTYGQPYGQSSYVWKAPYEEVDRKKWPNTFKWLLKFYFMSDYRTSTRWGDVKKDETPGTKQVWTGWGGED